MNARRLVVGLLVLGCGALLLQRFSQLQELVSTLRRGQPYFLFDFLWFALPMSYGLAMLFCRHDVQRYELAPAAVLLAEAIVAGRPGWMP